METHMRYLARSAIFETEKAFSTDFPVDHVEGARRTNHEIEERPITVAAITEPSQWHLDIHGFCILHDKTHLNPQDVYTKKNEVKDAYWGEIEAIVHKNFPQYSKIECFDLTVRKRDSDFPAVARPYRKEYEQPSITAHSDYSQLGGFLTLQHCFPGQEDYWADKEFDMLNVWRPLRGPTDDWPLTLCDYTTIDTEEDIRLNDAIRRDLVGEGSLLHYNKSHRWHYLSNQGTDDLIVFRNSNSHGKHARCFHAAVFNPAAQGPPRESVEGLKYTTNQINKFVTSHYQRPLYATIEHMLITLFTVRARAPLRKNCGQMSPQQFNYTDVKAAQYSLPKAK